MVATPPGGASETPGEAPSPPIVAGAEAQRQARYNHLVGRLRSRQITMEEATELFALMSAMLRASEAARRVAMVAAPPSPGMAIAPPQRPAGTAGVPAAADDLFLVGLLAMGAGAGMLAAMARRIAEGAPAPPNPAKGLVAPRDA